MRRNDFSSGIYISAHLFPLLSLLMQLQKRVNGSGDWKWSGSGGAAEGWKDVSQKTDNWCLRLNEKADDEAGRRSDVVTEFKTSEVLKTFSFSSRWFYNIVLTVMNMFGGIYKPSGYLSILYQVSKRALQ